MENFNMNIVYKIHTGRSSTITLIS